jgi:DNA (cytosine-5)-methyltransferase 1
MKKTDLLEVAGIYSQTLAKMGKNEAISMDTLGKICAALNCRIEDIVEFIPDQLDNANKN